MDDLQKGVRYLVRTVMRERGIKHRSTKKFINSVCYAQHPTKSIEYDGPIIIHYNKKEHHVLCAAVRSDAPVVLKAHGPLQWNHKGFIDSLLLEYFYDSVRRTIGFTPKSEKEYNIESAKFGIQRPDFCDRLGSFLDKHIKDHNKRPSKWKRLFKDNDELSKVVYVPDKAQEYNWTPPGFKKWLLEKFLGVSEDRIHEAWAHAIKRHFRCDDQELVEIFNTVRALSTIDRNIIEKNTERIIEGEWEEYD